MKPFFFLLLALVFRASVLGQAVPPQYPYPVPLPASGTISPSIGIQLTLPVNTTAYGDPRPAVWDAFVGGGFRSVGTTNERNAIVNGRRKEGMMVMVKAIDSDTNKFGLYMLLNGFSNTNWYKLANITTTNGFEIPSMMSVNIYNQDGELTGDRSLSGVGLYSLLFGGLTTFGVAADTADINATTASILGINSLTLGSADLLQLSAPVIYLASSNILNTNAIAGWVWTLIDEQSGYSEWQESTGGVNVYNSDGDFTGDRIVSGAGFNFTLRDIPFWQVENVTDVDWFIDQSMTLFCDTDGLVKASDSLTLEGGGTGSNVTLNSAGLLLEAGSSEIASLQAGTVNVLGQVLATVSATNVNLVANGGGLISLDSGGILPFLFSATPNDGQTDDYVLGINPVTGEVRWSASYNVSSGGATLVNPQAGTTYTAQASDCGKAITTSNGSPVTITVDTSFPDGCSVEVFQSGAGQVTISPTGLTIRNRESFTKTAGQYGSIKLIRIGTDLWLSGDGAI